MGRPIAREDWTYYGDPASVEADTKAGAAAGVENTTTPKKKTAENERRLEEECKDVRQMIDKELRGPLSPIR